MGGLCNCCASPAESAFPRKEGRKMNRAITDKLMGVLCLLFVAGMVIIIGCGLKYGNPKRLTHGVDWAGNICGYDTAVKNTPYMMFCGSADRQNEFPKFILEGSTVCVDRCPIDAMAQIDCLMPAFHNFTSYRGGSIGGTIPNVETLEMTLTQSVTKQNTYPTEEWGGRFCLPSSKNPTLRNVIIDGPWGQYYRPLLSVGGLMDAWPLFLISGCTAALLGFVYLLLLQIAAGPLIFFSMIMSTLLSLAAGIFFFLAILMDMNDASSDYASLNPITSMYIGEEAKIYSIITGVVLILISAALAGMTVTSLAHIDECIGLIEAACDCAGRRGCALQIFATLQGASVLALVVFFVLFGLPHVASLGQLSNSEININGIPILGLQKVYKMNWYEHVGFWYYFVGMFYLLECYLQFGHYVLAYTVSCWYFSPGQMKKVSNNGLIKKALGRGVGKQVEVRVAGVDNNADMRRGTVVGQDGQKMLVVPLGKKGPGTNRHELVEEEWQKLKDPSLLDIAGGAITAWMHLGTLALGAPIICVFRPFRMMSQFVSSFIARSAEEGMAATHSDDPHSANIKGSLSLLSSCLEQAFGKYSKDAFTELVLSGGGEDGADGFLACSEQSFQFMVNVGGSIAHLHGAMMVYELFGTLSITAFCGWLCMVLQAKLDMFNEKSSAYYVEDKNASGVVAMVVAFAVAFAWMSMWSQTADVLLYCVAWNRRQLHEGEEHNLEHSQLIKEVTEYCPQTIRNILPAHELEAAHEHGLHAHGLGQQGAILAAMEHGAVGGGASGPDYAKHVAVAHTMATKMVG